MKVYKTENKNFFPYYILLPPQSLPLHQEIIIIKHLKYIYPHKWDSLTHVCILPCKLIVDIYFKKFTKEIWKISMRLNQI